jgi:WD40 repeat protein
MSGKKITVEKIATLAGHRDCVYTLEEANEPHLFFSAAGDGMVVRWDLQQLGTGKLIAQVPASVYAMRYLPEANQLWIGQNFAGIHVIDLASQQEVHSVQLTTAAIFDIQYQNQYALIATGDGTIVVLDMTLMVVKNRLKNSDKSVRCLQVNPVMGELAAGYSDHSIRIFDLQDFRLKYTLEGHTNSVFTLAYSPDYRYLLSGSRDAHLKVWDATSGYQLRQSIVAHLYAINHICYSPDGQYFATGSMDKSVKVWDAGTFRLLKVIDRARHAGHGTSVNKLLWSDYQFQLVSGSDDRTISVWNIDFD